MKLLILCLLAGVALVTAQVPHRCGKSARAACSVISYYHAWLAETHVIDTLALIVSFCSGATGLGFPRLKSKLVSLIRQESLFVTCPHVYLQSELDFINGGRTQIRGRIAYDEFNERFRILEQYEFRNPNSDYFFGRYYFFKEVSMFKLQDWAIQ